MKPLCVRLHAEGEVDAMTDRALLNFALEARRNAYTPYSGFRVGAALLGKSGKVFTGCNIENAAFSPTLCAERVALAKAVSEGERSFVAIAVAGGREERAEPFVPPCGVCLQTMIEFCAPDRLYVILGDARREQRFLLQDLLPKGFSPAQLTGEHVK